VQLKRKPGVLQRNDGIKPNVKNIGRGRGHSSAESNVDESQYVQMKSVFSEGPMMAQAHVNNSRLHSGKIFSKYLLMFICCYLFFVVFSEKQYTFIGTEITHFTCQIFQHDAWLFCDLHQTLCNLFMWYIMVI